MMSEGLTASRPRVSASLVVDIDNQFTHDRAVSKCHDAPITFEFAVCYEPRHQTFMNSAHVADCIPNKFFVPLNFNFFADSGHNVFLGSLISIKDLSNWCAPQTRDRPDWRGLPVSVPAP